MTTLLPHVASALNEQLARSSAVIDVTLGDEEHRVVVSRVPVVGDRLWLEGASEEEVRVVDVQLLPVDIGTDAFVEVEPARRRR